MDLYIAALYTSNYGVGSRLYAASTPSAKALRAEVTHLLESYHYIHKQSFVDQIRKDGERVFLDSGAFSAFTQGVVIPIEQYADYIKTNKDIIKMASVLDAIGDPEGTYHNQNKLESLGVEVLPCFHFGEPLDLCEYYVRNYPYMTIGGMVPIPNNKLMPWLDEVWDKVLTDKDGVARTKVHGFGLTARVLMERYPWYSVDSSSWVQMAANGNLIFPEINKAIPISSRSPAKKIFGQHFDSYPPEAQARVLELLAFYGLTLEEVQDDYKSRWAFNAFSFDRVGKNLGEDHWRKPFRAVQPLLF